MPESETVLKGVTKIVNRHNLFHAPVCRESRLADLGIDSLTLVSIAAELEDVFSLVIPPEMLTEENFHTIGAIAALIGRLRAGQ
jgi:acyl carrier protein